MIPLAGRRTIGAVRRAACLLAVGSLLWLGACDRAPTRVAPSAPLPAPPPTAAPSDSLPGFPQPPWQAAAHVAADLGYAAPDGFGGIAIDQAEQAIDLYVVNGYRALADQLLDAARPYGRVFWVERPYAALIAARDQIAREMDWVKGIGLQPSTWGPDERSNTVFINVPAFTAAQEDAVHARFGSFVDLHVSNEHLAFA